MKKLVCLALSAGMALAVGCGGDDGGGGGDDAFASFDWGAPADCPDLSPAGGGREAAVIVDGDDSEFGGLESFAFDCGDGVSPNLPIDDGTWTYSAEVVDLYDLAPGSGIPEDCFGDTLNEECLYYTTGEDTVGPFDTLFEDPDVILDPLYGFGNFDVQYSMDGVVDNPDAVDCSDFSPTGDGGEGPAVDMSIVATFYAGSGLVEDLFVCGGGGNVISRDLPLGDFALDFSLLNSDGDAIQLGQVTPDPLDCPAGICTLDTHLETVELDINFDDPTL